jgi:hypothetical protein
MTFSAVRFSRYAAGDPLTGGGLDDQLLAAFFPPTVYGCLLVADILNDHESTQPDHKTDRKPFPTAFH